MLCNINKIFLHGIFFVSVCIAAKAAEVFRLVFIISTAPPPALSNMPAGGAAAVLSGRLFERLDHSQSRVPAVPQSVRPRRAAAGHADGVDLAVKESLAKQALLHARRAEAACKSSSAQADSCPIFNYVKPSETSTAKPNRGSHPAVEILCSWLLKPTAAKKSNPQRVEFPPQPSRPDRGRNLRRANVAPLWTADRLRSCAAPRRRLARTEPGPLRQVFMIR